MANPIIVAKSGSGDARACLAVRNAILVVKNK